MSGHEEEILGKAYDARLMRRRPKGLDPAVEAGVGARRAGAAKCGKHRRKRRDEAWRHLVSRPIFIRLAGEIDSLMVEEG